MIFYKNHLKTHNLDFKNDNFINSGSCSRTNAFSKTLFFFCSRYFTKPSLFEEKGFAAKGFLVDDVNKKPTKKRDKILRRTSLILPKHIGRVFFVHNGKSFSSIQVYKKMLGHKFGEFASTRKKPVHKKKRKTRNQ